MSKIDLWKKYCVFYEKNFSEQLAYNKTRMNRYFEKWKKTDMARMLNCDYLKNFKDVPITTYVDYPMLAEFADRISNVTKKNPKRKGELLWQYYMRIGREAGAFLDRYMVEPFYFCAKTTGTTGASKWVAYGKSFHENFAKGTAATITIACSDDWGETKLKDGDAAFNVIAPVPYISGWGAAVFQTHLRLIPPLSVTDNLNDMKKKFLLLLKEIERGNKIDVGGGIGSIFYMICKYFVKPEEFYGEYYRSMQFGMKKILLLLKRLLLKFQSGKEKDILDYLPLKGIIVGGMEAHLYLEFFRREFRLDPLQGYGSTEAGNLMRGDPDRKAALVPDLRTNYLEFKTENGEIKDLNELKRDEVYDLIVTPFGSILFRYDIGDLFRVVDFRDDGMPILAFEGRRETVLDIYGYYRVTPCILVQALAKAGLKSSDKWAVAKLLEPKEHLCFLMEKTWEYSEKMAEQLIYNSLLEIHEDFKKYVKDFRIKNPSEALRVEYLRPGAFMRYSALKAKMGVPLGQYKPPQVIPPNRIEIYETLRSV